MRNKNISFLILILITTILVIGVIAENLRLDTIPENTGIAAEAKRVRKRIRNAGLSPRRARHWKESP